MNPIEGFGRTTDVAVFPGIVCPGIFEGMTHHWLQPYFRNVLTDESIKVHSALQRKNRKPDVRNDGR